MRTLTGSITKLTVLSVILLVVLTVNYIRAWSGPSGIAPNTNTPAPINTSGALQEKTGGLKLESLWSTTSVLSGAYYFNVTPDQILYSDGGTNGQLVWKSGNPTKTQMVFQDSNGALHGKVFSDNGGDWFGLRDSSNAWTVLSINDKATPANSQMRLQVNNDTKMTIQSDGKVGIGYAAPTYKLAVNGTAAANAFVYTSDARLKENIEDAPGLEVVERLRGVKFDWKDSGDASYGLIAQEVENVLPELGSTDENGMKSVAYGNLVSVLIEAVKEQQNQIDTLKNEIESLKQ